MPYAARSHRFPDPGSNFSPNFTSSKNRRIRILLKSVFALSLLGLTEFGCGNLPSVSRQDIHESTDTLIYIDGIGRQVEIPKHPLRIISLAPNITETLYLLGAQDRLIGNTTQCNWPEDAKHKPKIGDLINPNYEVILAAEPDLIIASTAGNDQSAVMKLTGFGLPVYVAAPRSVAMIFQSVEDIGRITDCAAQGRKLVAQMNERLERIRL